MEKLIAQLSKDFPDFNFVVGEICCWSPARQEVIYNPDKTDSASRWAILHELGHALLGHNSYQSDFELLKLEAAAWDRAQELDKTYGQKISPEHIQNYLDTYRDWLYRRSLCPTCGNSSLQENPTRYRCFNCHTVWKVTAARFCRPYRRVHLPENEKSLGTIKPQATFM